MGPQRLNDDSLSVNIRIKKKTHEVLRQIAFDYRYPMVRMFDLLAFDEKMHGLLLKKVALKK